ncbi:MAG: class IV adenylate cyclase [Chloroflexota bacterium]
MLETEVKFHLNDLPALRERLLAAGAHIHKPRVFERNVRFDTVDESLLAHDALLRLRQDTAVRLTLKIPPSAAEQSRQVKVMQELEVSVSDFDTMSQILERLGYGPVQVYEKYRETFTLDGVEIVLDQLPYGDFIELEGDEAIIRRLADRLGLIWDKRILTNYLALMAQLQAHHNLPFTDLTFANFKERPYHISAILP